MRSADCRAPTPSTLGIAAPNPHHDVMKRTKRPPAYLSPSPPVPEPEPLDAPVPPGGEEERLDPTRYGDWEKKGIAVDF
jgi:hypothetical protein